VSVVVATSDVLARFDAYLVHPRLERQLDASPARLIELDHQPLIGNANVEPALEIFGQHETCVRLPHIGDDDIAGARQVDVERRMLRTAFGIHGAAERLANANWYCLVERDAAVAGGVRGAAKAGHQVVREVRRANAIGFLRRFGLG
jgi:hypothetical protein